MTLTQSALKGPTGRKEIEMDDDRVEGAAQKGQGKIKEALGGLTGDAKLKADGRKDQAAGGVNNAVGGIKDAVRGKD